MRKILVPVDFSPVSKNAFIYGLNLYKDTDTQFDVLHVYHPSFDPIQPDILDPTLGLESIKAKNLEDFINSIKELAEANNVKITGKLELGFTIEKIIELSKDYDLIIMGSTGESNFLNKFFGGISSEVAVKAHCPVLLVPRGVTYSPLKNIIYACDFDGVDESIMQKVVEFAKRYNAKLHFVHIQNKDKEFDFKIENVHGIEYTINIVEAESVKEGLSSFIESHDVDLVIMATKKRSFWQQIIHKSHTKEFALNSKVPLLVYHQK